ncbi:imelysin family protein [Chitinibacteraceae bacterium HSL-7]
MKRLGLAVLAITGLAHANPEAPAIPRLPPPALALSLTDTIYQPMQLSLLERTGKLSGALAAYCGKPGPQRLDEARNAWKQVNQAWRRLDTVRMGPTRDEEVVQQFDPWPIDVSEIKKQIAAAPKDPLSNEAMSRTPQLVAGLPALEYLLFGQPGKAPLDTAKPEAECRYGLWVAAGLARRAQVLTYEWQGMRRSLTYDLSYPRPFLSESLTRVHAGIAELAGWKLAAKVEEPTAIDFPDWRSGQTRSNIAVGLAAAERVLLGEAGGAGYEEFLLTRGKQDVVDQLKEKLANARIALAGLPDDLAAAPSERKIAHDRLNDLADFVAGPLAEALGLPLAKQ